MDGLDIPVPRRQIDAIIFDCDGVLIDSERLQCSILQRLAERHGLRLTLAASETLFRGRRLAECIETIEERVGRKAPEMEADFRLQLSLRMTDELRPVRNVRRVLQQIRVPFGTASNSRRDQIQRSLEVTGLAAYFPHHVFSAYDVGLWKPDPAVYLTASTAIGVDPARCLAVEDSEAGLMAANSAGMFVVRYSPPAMKNIRTSLECHQVDDMLQVLDFVDGRVK